MINSCFSYPLTYLGRTPTLRPWTTRTTERTRCIDEVEHGHASFYTGKLILFHRFYLCLLLKYTGVTRLTSNTIQSNILTLNCVRNSRQLNVSKLRGCPQHSEAISNISKQVTLISYRSRHRLLVRIRHSRQLNASKLRGCPQHSEATQKLYNIHNMNNFTRVDTYMEHPVQWREKVRLERQDKNKSDNDSKNAEKKGIKLAGRERLIVSGTTIK